MPSTALGLVIFVTFLAPGYCSLLRRERGRRPQVGFSVFRETVALLLSGVSANVLVLAIFGALRASFPEHTPDVGHLIRDPQGYREAHYAYLLWWGGGLLGLSCVLAFVAASVEWTDLRGIRRLRQSARLGWLVASRYGTTGTSAWWTVFEKYGSDIYKRVLCRLDDGKHVEGTLWTYNSELRETPDRELTLWDPIQIITPQGGRAFYDRGVVIVSARRIVYLYADYRRGVAREGPSSAVDWLYQVRSSRWPTRRIQHDTQERASQKG